MRIFGAGLILISLSLVPAFGRGGGHAGGGGHASSAGGGHASSGFRGGSVGSGFRAGGASRGYYGGYRGNFGRFGRGYYGSGFGLGFYNPWLWNYGYPYYSYPDNYANYAPAYSDVPPVIVNQDFQPGYAAPLVQEYGREYPPPPPPPDANPPAGNWNAFGQNTAPDQEPLFLLATKDGVIRAVLAYWAEKDTVLYVTMDHERKSVPIASIDRQLSSRLNRERGVSFGLPR
jgi:hypothetical protein